MPLKKPNQNTTIDNNSSVRRKWSSATSKLLWCLYPDSIVIYDAYVERTLVVMQCLDEKLADLPRIGTAPSVRTIKDIKDATQHYLAYQNLVKRLYSCHAKDLISLRKISKEKYPYDIRIIDQLLWMIGNPDQKVLLKGTNSN